MINIQKLSKFSLFIMIAGLIITSSSNAMQISEKHQNVSLVEQDFVIDGGIQYFPGIIVGPYIQNVDKTGITIVWRTNIPTFINIVYWGDSPDCDNVVTEPLLLCFEVPNLHIVRLEGLSPSTQYYYKVFSDSVESEIYNFFTAFEEEDTVTFVAYGDTRGEWDDPSWYNAGMVAQAIEEQSPYIVLHTGDLVSSGFDPYSWIDFFEISSFIHNSTLYPVLGNHEVNQVPYFDYFCLPDSGYNERWYSFDNGDIHFIGLDSTMIGRYNLFQTLWLIDDLENNDKTWIIVFFHHPLYSSGYHGSDIELRDIWHDIFADYNVDIVFNGHDHDYERTKKINNVTYIVTGGGGAPVRDFPDEPPWFTEYREKTYHFCLVSADQSELIFQAIKPDSTVFDSFTLEPNGNDELEDDKVLSSHTTMDQYSVDMHTAFIYFK